MIHEFQEEQPNTRYSPIEKKYALVSIYTIMVKYLELILLMASSRLAE